MARANWGSLTERESRTARLAAALAALSIVVGIAGSARTPPMNRAIAIHGSHSLIMAISNDPFLSARHGLYAELRELAPGATIHLPVGHPLDERALTSISLLTAEPVATAAATAGSLTPLITRSGIVEGGVDHRGRFWDYELKVSPDPAVLRVVVGDDAILIEEIEPGLRSHR